MNNIFSSSPVFAANYSLSSAKWPSRSANCLRPLSLVVCLAIICGTLRAGEFAFVVDRSLSMTADDGKVVKLPRYSVIDVAESNGNRVTLTHAGQEFSAARSQLYLSSDFPSVNDDTEQDFRHVIQSLAVADSTAENGRHKLAITMAEEALSRLDLVVARGSLFHALVKQFQAYEYYRLEDYDNALKLLAQSERLIANLNLNSHFVSAEGMQIRALIYVGSERNDDAVDVYHEATLLLLNSLGAQHIDTASAFSNLSVALFNQERYSEALFSQRIALNVLEQILPATDERLASEAAWLAAVARDAERYNVALDACRKAVQRYTTYHPSQLADLLSVYTDVIYINTEIQGYEAAENMCETALSLIAQLPAAERAAARRDIAIRQGQIDFEQERYENARAHFQAAVDERDERSPNADDGLAEESIGDVFVATEDLGNAKAAYERAIIRYAESDGPESDSVLDLREYTDNLTSDRDDTLSDVVVVALPQGYLLNDQGSIEHEVPGLTVLNWLSFDEHFHRVEFRGKEYRLANSQLRTFRNLPGYAFAKPAVFQTLLQNFSDSISAFDQRKLQEAESHINLAVELSRREYGDATSLTKWLQLMQIGILSRTRGTEEALERLNAIEPKLLEINHNAYSFEVDLNRLKGAFAFDQDELEAAALHYEAARDAAIEQFGNQHSVVVNQTRHLAKSLRRDEKFEEALAEFQDALEIAKEIYPAGSSEVADISSELSVVLIDLNRLDEAEDMLEAVVETSDRLPSESYLGLAASLGRVYAKNEKDASAREIMTAIKEELIEDDQLNSVPALMSLQVLSQLDIKEQEWENAIEHLLLTIEVMDQLELSDTFEFSEGHRRLAAAYIEVGNHNEARKHLQEVLRIYELLGGSQSPQADAIREQLNRLPTPGNNSVSTRDFRGLRSLLQLLPPNERMIVLTSDCSVTTAPESNSGQVHQASAGQTFWSLEQKNGMHRIYVPAQKDYGWIPTDKTEALNEQLIEEATAELRSKIGKDHPEETDTLIKAFEEAHNADDKDAKRKLGLLEKAADRIDAASSGNALIAVLIEDMLRIRFNEGEPVLSDVNNELLFPILHDTLGDSHPTVAALWFSRAMIARELGNMAGQTNRLKQVVRICEHNFGPENPRTIAYAISLAASNKLEGHFQLSRRILEQAAKQAENRPDLVLIFATALRGLGELYAEDRQYDSAIEHLTRSNEAFEQTAYALPEAIVKNHTCLAWCYLQKEELNQAKKSLDACEPFLDSMSPETRISHLTNKLSVTTATEENFTAALDQLARDADEIDAEVSQMNDLYRRLSMARAESAVIKAVDGMDETLRQTHDRFRRVFPFLTLPQQISSVAAAQQDLMEATAVTLVHDAKVTKSATASWVINMHGQLAEILAIDRQARALTTDQDSLRLFLDWKRAAAQLMQLPAAVDVYDADRNIASSIESIVETESELFQKLPVSIRKLYNDRPEWIPLDDIRNRLIPGEVMLIVRQSESPGLLFGVADDSHHEKVMVTWIIPAAGEGHVEVVNLGPAFEIHEQVDQVREVIAEVAGRFAKSPFKSELLREENAAMTKLSAAIWLPMAGRLPADTTKLTFCLDDHLKLAPWYALPDQSGAPLIDSFLIRHLSTPRDLLRQPQKVRNTPSVFISNTEFQFGDPNLEKLPNEQREFLAFQTQGSKQRLNRSDLISAVTEESSDSEPDPDAITPSSDADEISTADAFSETLEQEAIYLQSEEASEYAMLSSRHGAILHIDVAAYEDRILQVPRSDQFAAPKLRMLVPFEDFDHSNPLMSCGLLLAGCGNDSLTNHLADGVMTGEEIAMMNLQDTDTVVLARAVKASPESGWTGNVHLPHVFQIAGANNVVSVVSPGNTPSNSGLLTHFYRQLSAGAATDAAVRSAMQHVRNSLGDDQQNMPVGLWAGLRFTGLNSERKPAEKTQPPKTAIDQSDAAAVARHILELYREKDIDGLLAYSQEEPVPANLLERFAPGTVRYKSLFGASSWRWRAVSQWNGELPKVFYTNQRNPSTVENATEAHVEFGRSRDELFVVSLRKSGNVWLFDDVHSPGIEDLEKKRP